jgi:hypothetical protein
VLALGSNRRLARLDLPVGGRHRRANSGDETIDSVHAGNPSPDSDGLEGVACAREPAQHEACRRAAFLGLHFFGMAKASLTRGGSGDDPNSASRPNARAISSVKPAGERRPLDGAPQM